MRRETPTDAARAALVPCGPGASVWLEARKMLPTAEVSQTGTTATGAEAW